ncbi:LpqB family beta-propeller domain-containing protein [Zhihengliuella sp.]|uniref:LpqB family beta-propeller domain-containing protein n=1 Tax=Zhihengliuella sp. TaxID=1954483 RepID=UPI002811036C|nr:LpqB family beta-propeller domain-containing protein [Zhihengliuella sp.]
MRTVLNRGRALLAGLAVVVLALSGCASIPTDGPVGVSAADATQPGGVAYEFNPPGPAEDAEPESIIQGFITAGLSPADEYGTAREFLTPQLSRTWQPSASTLVYTGQPNVVGGAGAGEFAVEVATTARIDEFGVMQRYETAKIETISMVLDEVDGQWRIGETPDLTLLEEGSFIDVFGSYPLYFYNATYSHAAPDFRWFARRQSLASTLVRALLDGPRPYLEGAVVTAFPETSELARNAVPVEGRTATVDFQEAVFADASALVRLRMQQQLELTLDGVNNIGAVQMTVNQTPITLEGSQEFVEVSAEAEVPDVQIGIADGQLVLYQGGSSTIEIGNIPDVRSYDPIEPAMSPAGAEVGGSQYAFVSGDRTHVYIVSQSTGSDGALAEAAMGERFIRPSMDVHGWLWAVDSGTGKVTVVRASAEEGLADRQTSEIAAEWLEGLTVDSFRVSPDGTRAAVVAGRGEERRLYVIGIIRDSTGVPRGFTELSMLPVSVPVGQVVWDATDAVIVMDPSGTEPVRPERVRLDGRTEPLNVLLGMTSISSGPGDDIIVYAEAQGTVWSQVANVWKDNGIEMRGLAYPG